MRILLLNAYGMGGTDPNDVQPRGGASPVSTTVELISMMRRREAPFFAFPDGVRGAARSTIRAAGAARRLRGRCRAC